MQMMPFLLTDAVTVMENAVNADAVFFLLTCAVAVAN